MKESIGYTVTLNIMIVFITIVIAFLSAALIYFKSNKASNMITSSIEKYEGYNKNSINQINNDLTTLGYNRKKLNCKTTETDKGAIGNSCSLVKPSDVGVNSEVVGQNGYCVYKCLAKNEEGQYAGYYFYKIRTNMLLTIPIIDSILDIPIYSNTNRLYDFG